MDSKSNSHYYNAKTLRCLRAGKTSEISSKSRCKIEREKGIWLVTVTEPWALLHRSGERREPTLCKAGDDSWYITPRHKSLTKPPYTNILYFLSEMSSIIPVPKKSAPKQLTDLRPVALTLLVMKTLDKIMKSFILSDPCLIHYNLHTGQEGVLKMPSCSFWIGCKRLELLRSHASSSSLLISTFKLCNLIF